MPVPKVYLVTMVSLVKMAERVNEVNIAGTQRIHLNKLN